MGLGPPCKHERAHGSEAETMTDYPNPLVEQPRADCETVGPFRKDQGTEETPGHVNSGAHKLRDVTCSILRLVGDSKPERIELVRYPVILATNQAPQEDCLNSEPSKLGAVPLPPLATHTFSMQPYQMSTSFN
jgi:hypothetical protein